MSSITSSFNQSAGPLLQAYVSVSPQRLAALKAGGVEIPDMQKGIFLIDTGASGTCIDPSILTPLGISPKDFVQVHTPSTKDGKPVSCPVYDVQFVFQGDDHDFKPVQLPHIRALSVMSSDFLHQGIHGLIGRDILDHCVLIYNGLTNSYTLTW